MAEHLANSAQAKWPTVLQGVAETQRPRRLNYRVTRMGSITSHKSGLGAHNRYWQPIYSSTDGLETSLASKTALLHGGELKSVAQEKIRKQPQHRQTTQSRQRRLATATVLSGRFAETLCSPVLCVMLCAVCRPPMLARLGCQTSLAGVVAPQVLVSALPLMVVIPTQSSIKHMPEF